MNKNALPLPLKREPLAMLGVEIPLNLGKNKALEQSPTSTLLDVTGRTDTKRSWCLKKRQLLINKKYLPISLVGGFMEQLTKVFFVLKMVLSLAGKAKRIFKKDKNGFTKKDV